jgi:hypothetical protein
MVIPAGDEVTETVQSMAVNYAVTVTGTLRPTLVAYRSGPFTVKATNTDGTGLVWDEEPVRAIRSNNGLTDPSGWGNSATNQTPLWAEIAEPVTETPTLTTPYSIGTNNGPLFCATSSDSIATVEAANFLDGRAGWASLLKTGDVLLLEMSNGTKLYIVTVDVQARIITLSTGLTIA